MNISAEHYKVSVTYDAAEEVVRVKLSNDSLSKSLNLGGPYPVASPSDVDTSLGQIRSFLNTYKVKDEDINSIIERVGEFKYISRVSCEALHFSVMNTMDAQQGRINSLLGQIIKITKFDRHNGTPSRSLLIDTFDIGEEQKIQLRMVLDQNGKFISFSFAKASGTMEGYKWYTKGHTVYLKDLKGDVVLAVDLEHFKKKDEDGGEGGLILVKSPKKNSIENENRSYLRLTMLKDKNWNIDRYNTQHFRGNVSKDGVALSSSFAKHTPIVQLTGSDVYFPKLDMDKLFATYKKDQFKDLTFSEIEDSYNECMGERTSLAQEQINFGHADLDMVEADAVVFCERLALLNQKKFRTNLTYRSCLLKNDALIGEEGFEHLNFGFLSKVSTTDFEDIVNQCQSATMLTATKSAIAQVLDQHKLTFSSAETATFQKELETCFAKFGGDACKEKASTWIGNRSLLNFLDKESGRRSDCSYSFASDSAAEDYANCYRTSLDLALDTYDLNFFREGAHSLGNTPVSYDDADYIAAHDKFRQCMIRQLEGENSPIDQKDKWYQFEQYCLTESLKVKMAAVLKEQAYSKMKELIAWMGDSNFSSDLRSSLDREISKILDETQTLSSYGDVQEKVALKLYSLVSSHYLMSKINAINDEKFKSGIKSFLLGGDLNTSSPVPSMRLSLRSVSRRVESQLSGLKPAERLTYVKNLIKTTEINSLNFEQENKITPSDRTALERTLDQRKKCLEDVSVAQNTSLSDEMTLCTLQAQANLDLEESRIKFEKMVTSHFLVDSDASNKLLSILTDLKSCLQKYASSEYIAQKRYEKMMKGCQSYAELQLKQNITRIKIQSYNSIIESPWDDFHQCTQDLSSQVANQAASIPEDYNLSAINSLGNIEEKDKYLSFFAEQHDELLKGASECESNLDQAIVIGVKNYFLKKVPSLGNLADSEKNKKVLANFFDEEMISQILKFNEVNASRRKDAGVDLGALVSDERVITTEFGVSSLANFLDTLGSYFDKGFVYDESGMRTELVVFKSQLKDFLHWYNSNPDTVTIREAKDFFGKSKLGEHLALAVVSEQVYTKFTKGINSMRAEEERSFFAKTSCKTYWQCFEKEKNPRLKKSYESMMKKYDNLLKLTKTMTSSYDFRRIIRPETSDGEKVIKLANDAVLAPAILGARPSAGAEENLMDALGSAILADNTDGGFSERFVQEVANYSLHEQEKSKYSITKWLFYDTGDFDWDTLRKTKSGQQALNYYARFIMLPKMLGQHQSRYIKNLRQTQFDNLMRQAQSENEH